MKKALIVYCKENEKTKNPNEEKTALILEKLFIEKGFAVKKTLLLTAKAKPKKEQTKSDKEIEFESKPPSTEGFDFIVIGSPIVGSLTSAPLINAFIRRIPKKKNPQKKQEFILYATGILPGFAVKKMASLLSMHGINVSHSETFTSIFEFDAKKTEEIKKFFLHATEQKKTD